MKKLFFPLLVIVAIPVSSATIEWEDTLSIDSVALCESGYSSSSSSIIPSVPTSPQAESFKRLGEFAVNNSSGTPDISISLGEINHHGYKIPLDLRYIPTPVKPGYNYDVYGWGWNLSTSFCISRTIESRPDEEVKFQIGDFWGKWYEQCKNSLSAFNFAYDKFHATLPNGTTFDFVIKNVEGQLQYVVSDGRSLQIKCNYTLNDISSFSIVDESGVCYLFDVADRAYTDAYTTIHNNVTWYLSSISLPNSERSIRFYYGPTIKTEHVSGFSEKTIYVAHHFVPETTNKVDVVTEEGNSNCYYKMRLLSSIVSDGGTIYLNYKNKAEECAHNCVSSICIVDDNCGKTIRFQYKQVKLAGHGSIADTLAMLNKIQIIGSYKNQLDTIAYTFDNSTPNYSSCIDHWGNYTQNGNEYNVANFNFYAEFPAEQGTGNSIIKLMEKEEGDMCPYTKFSLAGFDWYNEPRVSSSPYMHGILQRITYPNGGSTFFTFETHKFITAMDAKGNYIPIKKKRRIVQGGGFRIKRIENYDYQGKLRNTYSFSYGPTYAEVEDDSLNLPPGSPRGWCTGYGEPVVDPNILTYASFTSSRDTPAQIQYMLLGQDDMGCYSSFSNPFTGRYGQQYPWLWECRFSASNFRRLLNGRMPVVYPEITMYYGNASDVDDNSVLTTGKTVYKYDIYAREHGNDSSYVEELSYYGKTLACFELPYKRNCLKSKTDYKYEDGKFVKIGSEEYEYNQSSSSVTDYIYANSYPRETGFYPVVMVDAFFRPKASVYGYSHLRNKRIIQYDHGIALTKGFFYGYNEYSQITSMPHEYSSVRDVKIDYVTSDTSDVAVKMKQLNMLSASTSSYIYHDSYMLNGSKLEYSEYDQDGRKVYLPSAYYDVYLKNGEKIFSKQHHILSYTNNGNPMEIVDEQGMHTIYLWSYRDRYLVAEIKDCDYDTANNATLSVFGLGIKELTELHELDGEKLASLVNSSFLQNAITKVWTYQPSFGVTMETFPNGCSIYYDYDGLGRLKEIYRYKDNVVSSANRQVVEQHSYRRINK